MKDIILCRLYVERVIPLNHANPEYDDRGTITLKVGTTIHPVLLASVQKGKAHDRYQNGILLKVSKIGRASCRERV